MVFQVDNETLDEVLDKVKSLIKETSCDIPDGVIDRTMFYWSRAHLKNNIKLKLDLTKNRYKIFAKAIETVGSYDTVNYIMVEGSF